MSAPQLAVLAPSTAPVDDVLLQLDQLDPLACEARDCDLVAVCWMGPACCRQRGATLCEQHAEDAALRVGLLLARGDLVCAACHHLFPRFTDIRQAVAEVRI